MTQVLPAYLYQQYTQDPYSEDLQAFFTAYNNTSQAYLDNTNGLELPIYTSQSAPLLDWTALGVYGVIRPSLGSPITFSPLNVYDTVPYNTTAYSEDTENAPTGFYVVNDDTFKRILTWNFYKGDGFQYNTQWLKRRVARFLYGVDGTDIPNIDSLYNISVTYGSGETITITIPNIAIAPIFKSAIQSAALNLPFQYNYTIVY